MNPNSSNPISAVWRDEKKKEMVGVETNTGDGEEEKMQQKEWEGAGMLNCLQR